MKKSITIKETERGLNKYFVIYEVRAKKHDGEVITTDRFFNKKDAEKHVEFAHEYLGNLYSLLWVREELVWC